MTPGQEQHDRAVLHRVALGRYSTSVVRQVVGLLNRSDASVVAKIAAAHLAGTRRAAELEALLVSIRALQADGWALIGSRLDVTLADFGEVEGEFQHRLMGSGLKTIANVSVELQGGALTGPQVVAAAKARPFQGKFLREWLSDAEASAARRVRETIRQGFVESATIPEMVQRIRGTAANRYSDGMLEISRRGAEALVRTAISHTANVAALETYRATNANAGREIVSGWRFLATLDSRTSLKCAGLHLKEFPLGKGPAPPQHINCRSVSVPLLRGMEPFKVQDFSSWLAGQPVTVQDDLLGPTRGQLFRRGDLKVDRFTDNKGAVLTLDQLRKRDALAFERAGL